MSLDLPLQPPYPPMEARTAEEVPAGAGWRFEPKWDGFRCLVFRDGDEVYLQSKAGKPLGRYFPDVEAAMGRLGARRFVLDGELVIPVEGELSFDELQLRLHPAASRVAKLAAAHPAELVAFDLLVDDDGRSLVDQPLTARREALEGFAERFFAAAPALRLTPATDDRERAVRWLTSPTSSLDGVIAKLADQPYRSGEREGMVKVKRLRSADCVVGGFRYASAGKLVGSLLLGLYGDDGKLHHVGFTSSFDHAARRELTPRLEARRDRATAAGATIGFSGNAPGAPSRWSTERSTAWEALPPELVVEVLYDHWSGGRFRHGTRLLRFRPDKAPEQCTFDQVPRGARLEEALGAAGG
jgi:ATP-dependent DNA ligase